MVKFHCGYLEFVIFLKQTGPKGKESEEKKNNGEEVQGKTT